jgi:hypothetical protein
LELFPSELFETLFSVFQQNHRNFLVFPSFAGMKKSENYFEVLEKKLFWNSVEEVTHSIPLILSIKNKTNVQTASNEPSTFIILCIKMRFQLFEVVTN